MGEFIVSSKLIRAVEEDQLVCRTELMYLFPLELLKTRGLKRKYFFHHTQTISRAHCIFNLSTPGPNLLCIISIAGDLKEGFVFILI